MPSTEMVKFDKSNFRMAATEIQRSIPSAMSYLRMEKGTGDWVYGAAQDPLPKNTKFAVNLQSFMKGVIAWADTTNGSPASKLEEVMVPVTAPPVDPGPAPSGSRGWDKQLGFSGKVLGGKLDGLDLQFKGNSDGALRGVSALMTACAEGMDAHSGCMPVITLSSTSYKHASYGKIFKPEFAIDHWEKEPGGPPAKKKIAKK